MSHLDDSKRSLANSGIPEGEAPADPDRAAILARRNLFIAMAMSGITAATVLPACAGETTEDPAAGGSSAMAGAVACLSLVTGGTSEAGGAVPCLSPLLTGGEPGAGGAVPCLSVMLTGGTPSAGGAMPCLTAPLGGKDPGTGGTG